MRKSPDIKISELDLDQIFSDDHEITGSRIPKILQIPLDMIDEFPDHPFQVRLDEETNDEGRKENPGADLGANDSDT